MAIPKKHQKTRLIAVRFTPTDFDAIRKRSQLWGKSPSAYVREAAMTSARVPVVQTLADAAKGKGKAA